MKIVVPATSIYRALLPANLFPFTNSQRFGGNTFETDGLAHCLICAAVTGKVGASSKISVCATH